jgi:hypothetical protein
MKDIKATASDHMRRDLEAGNKWTCQCEACANFRSLVGVEKVLDVRPLVRAIEQTEADLDALPPGPERQRLLEQYLRLYDELAELMAE